MQENNLISTCSDSLSSQIYYTWVQPLNNRSAVYSAVCDIQNKEAKIFQPFANGSSDQFEPRLVNLQNGKLGLFWIEKEIQNGSYSLKFQLREQKKGLSEN